MFNAHTAVVLDTSGAFYMVNDRREIKEKRFEGVTFMPIRKVHQPL
ncbi:hypothetical protein KEH51_06300 [[Brevibacterium] frigoritolerans]|uniref:Uncharacterized protein n=1 Tax=Peribacillus frigoritolerans TaxID=450367 RepID=A0A941J6B4_9BACI|nr:hypothetical protein [Peribacillus frigoritolerans]